MNKQCYDWLNPKRSYDPSITDYLKEIGMWILMFLIGIIAVPVVWFVLSVVLLLED